MGGKTSEYTVELLSFGNNDRIDVSKLLSTSPDVWETQFVKFSTLKTALNQSLTQVLAVDNVTDGYSVIFNTGDDAIFWNGSATFKTYLTNSQSTTSDKVVYLPQYDGQLAYHAVGVPLTDNYAVIGGANGILESSTVIYDNGGGFIGFGTTSPIARGHFYINDGASLHQLAIQNANASGNTSIRFSEGTQNAFAISRINSSSVFAHSNYANSLLFDLKNFDNTQINNFNFVLFTSATNQAFRVVSDSTGLTLGGNPLFSVNKSGFVGVGTDSDVGAAPNTFQVYSSPNSVFGLGKYFNASIYSSTAHGAGIGSGLVFGAKYTDAGNITPLAGISGSKLYASTGDFSGKLELWVRHPGGFTASTLVSEVWGGKTANGFGVSSPTASIHVSGISNDSNYYYFKGEDSSNVARFYGRNDGAHAINSASLVTSAALKIKGRLIVSTQEVTGNDNYNVMLEVGVGNGVLFSDGTNGATGNNQLGYIFGDGGLQIRGRNNASAEKFNFSAKSSANRFEFYSDDANTHIKMTAPGIINYTHTVANDGFNILSPNTGITTNAVYSSLSVVNADSTPNRLGIIGFTAIANTARHAFIGARYIDGNNGDLILGTKSGGSESIKVTIAANGEVFLNLPTSAGTAGSLWNDSGTVKVA